MHRRGEGVLPLGWEGEVGGRESGTRVAREVCTPIGSKV